MQGQSDDMRRKIVSIARTQIVAVILPLAMQCQNITSGAAGQTQVTSTSDYSSGSAPPEQTPKHVLWVIPNFRTSPFPEEYAPITPKEKFNIAAQDSFDRGTVALAAVFAAEGQLGNATPSFGQGVRGYSRYFGTSYADFVIGNYMTEAIYPTILHQDPRYFRKGAGSGWSRFAYVIGQSFWTHNDSGRGQFNFSEVVGNSTAVAISNAYYPDHRTAGNAVSKLGLQIGVDTAANIAKEFWPDLERRFSRKHRGE